MKWNRRRAENKFEKKKKKRKKENTGNSGTLNKMPHAFLR